MTSTNKTAVNPTSLYICSAIHLYSADASPNTGCTKGFPCLPQHLKSNFLNRTTISHKTLYCKLFPSPYQQHRGKIIKKVSNLLLHE